MTAPSSLHIGELVLPGVDARTSERTVQDLQVQLGALEAADLAQGIPWRQPDHGINLMLDTGPSGNIDLKAMAAAIRGHFVESGRRP